MQGQELRYVLVRIGLKYSEYSTIIGKSESTIQRWISFDSIIGERYLIPLKNLISKKVFEKIEKEWALKRKAEQMLMEENRERSRIHLERTRSIQS